MTIETYKMLDNVINKAVKEGKQLGFTDCLNEVSNLLNILNREDIVPELIRCYNRRYGGMPNNMAKGSGGINNESN